MTEDDVTVARRGLVRSARDVAKLWRVMDENRSALQLRALFPVLYRELVCLDRAVDELRFVGGPQEIPKL